MDDKSLPERIPAADKTLQHRLSEYRLRGAGLFGRPLAESVLERGLVELEERAQLQFDLGRNLRKEVVGLGFRVKPAMQAVKATTFSHVHDPEFPEDWDLGAFSWVQLTNTLNVSSAGGNAGNEFMVSGDEVRFVLRRVEAYLVGQMDLSRPENKGYIDGDLYKGKAPVVEFVLWHSHYNNVEPSGRDAQIFPKWLANVGVVYHAPTQTSTRYNGGGIISPLEVSNSAPSTTGDNA